MIDWQLGDAGHPAREAKRGPVEPPAEAAARRHRQGRGVAMTLVFALLLSLALPGCTVDIGTSADVAPKMREATTDEQLAAHAAADLIIAAIDDEDWDHVWDQASTVLKKQTSKFALKAVPLAARGMFGDFLGRKPLGYAFPETIEGFPPGRFAVVFYAADFSRVRGTQESVVLVWEDDTWRLGGYWVRQVPGAGKTP